MSSKSKEFDQRSRKQQKQSQKIKKSNEGTFFGASSNPFIQAKPVIQQKTVSPSDKEKIRETTTSSSKSESSNMDNDTKKGMTFYSSKNQFKHLSKEDSKTISPDSDYTNKMKKKYDKQSTKFNKKYDKQKAAGEVNPRNRKLKEGWRHPSRKGLIVSGDGKMAVEALGAKSTQAWADESLINKSNAELKRKKSFITLKKERADLVVGSVPNQTGTNPSKNSFRKIKPVHIDKEGKEKDMTKSSNTETREFGPYNKKETVKSLQTLKFRDCGNANELILGCIQDDKNGFLHRAYKSKDGSINVETKNPIDTIKQYIYKLMKKEFPDNEKLTDITTAYNAYKKLPVTQRAAVDEKYGLNKYARPDLGQGVITIAPDFKDKKPESNNSTLSNNTVNMEVNTPTEYNYHFATNIVQSDSTGAYITCEGLVNNSIWYFSMYGTQKGESFHETQKDFVQKPNVSAIVDKK